jgi:hypothetical protein
MMDKIVVWNAWECLGMRIFSPMYRHNLLGMKNDDYSFDINILGFTFQYLKFL